MGNRQQMMDYSPYYPPLDKRADIFLFLIRDVTTMDFIKRIFISITRVPVKTGIF